MRAVIQRVKNAKVVVEGKEVSSIGHGILTLFGVEKGDTEAQVEKTIQKICGLRIFEDDQGKMNRDLKEVNGAHLIVSQFTLLGDCSKGRRPSFVQAEEPKRANKLYELSLKISSDQGIPTHGGSFRSDMKVELVNDGPVTFILEF